MPKPCGCFQEYDCCVSCTEYCSTFLNVFFGVCSHFSFQIHAMIPIVMMPCSLVIVKTYIDNGV